MAKKMKFEITALIMLSVCHFSNLKPIEDSSIVSFEFVTYPNSSYYYSYETSQGESKSEFGDFTEINGIKALHIEGKFQFTSDDGKEYRFVYTSGVDGFQLTPDNSNDYDDRISETVIKSLLG